MRNIRNWLACRKQHEHWHFTWDVSILFIGNGVMSFLFLIFHMLTGRKMGGEAYAEYMAMIGLFNVLAVPASAMQYTMARYIAEQHQLSESETWLLIVRRGLSSVTRWGLLALVVWCLCAPMLRSVLNATAAINLVMVGVIAFVFLYTPILGGSLQGSRRFGWFAFSGIGVAVSRLLMVLPVLWSSGGVAVVLTVVAASYVVGLLISYWPLRGKTPVQPAATLPAPRDVQIYFWGVLLGQLAILTLIFADVILSKRLFSGEALAAYGKVAALSRIVLFLPLPIIIAMFPRAVTSGNPRILIAPLLATLGVTVSAALFISLWPALPMKLVYGISDPTHLELLRKYVWAAIPLALLNIVSPYLWARKEVWLTLWILPVTGIYVLSLLVRPVAPLEVIGSLFCAGLLALVLLLGLTFRILREDAVEESDREGQQT
jgi:O-antigen/teichoic acid export membrane protein